MILEEDSFRCGPAMSVAKHITTKLEKLIINNNNNNNGRNGSFLRGWLPHRGKAQMACN